MLYILDNIVVFFYRWLYDIMWIVYILCSHKFSKHSPEMFSLYCCYILYINTSVHYKLITAFYVLFLQLFSFWDISLLTEWSKLRKILEMNQLKIRYLVAIDKFRQQFFLFCVGLVQILRCQKVGSAKTPIPLVLGYSQHPLFV